MPKPAKEEYALYKGDDLIAVGMAREIAEQLNVKVETVRWMSTPAYKKRIAARKRSRNPKIVYRVS